MKLVTRCDDLGSFRAANRSILDAVERGLARNVGFMVPGPAFGEAVEMFRGRKDVCLGCTPPSPQNGKTYAGNRSCLAPKCPV
jgi:predicted glycoside hydrolase/deacetylase ChbG (UPF0249 family)